MVENGIIKVGSKNVSNILNRYYVSKVRKLREKMKNLKSGKSDPMKMFSKYVKTPLQKLKIKEINMSELDVIFKKIKKTNSTSCDNISMKTAPPSPNRKSMGNSDY